VEAAVLEAGQLLLVEAAVWPAMEAAQLLLRPPAIGTASTPADHVTAPLLPSHPLPLVSVSGLLY
jgi:hypothetical protein